MLSTEPSSCWGSPCLEGTAPSRMQDSGGAGRGQHWPGYHTHMDSPGAAAEGRGVPRRLEVTPWRRPLAQGK